MLGGLKGSDCVVLAKAGTGKTLTYAIHLCEGLKAVNRPQVGDDGEEW